MKKQVLRFCQTRKKTVKYEGDGETNFVLKDWKEGWMSWKSEDEPRLFRLQH